MKKLLSLALAAGFTLISYQPTFAQDAKQILQKVSTKYSPSKGTKSNFTLKFIDSKGTVKSTQSGTVAIKGNKYKVKSGNLVIITDGKSTWTYNVKDKEVQIDNYNANAAMSPAKLLSGTYEKDYTYKYVSETKVDNKAAYIIELTPKVAKKEFTKVQLFVAKSTNDVLGGKVFEKNGSVINYTLSNTTTNATIPDSEFTFDQKKYPGVDVIDLR